MRGTPLQMRLAANLRGARSAARMTREALADLSGYSADHIRHIERCKRTPSIMCLDTLAQALGVKLSELVGTVKV